MLFLVDKNSTVFLQRFGENRMEKVAVEALNKINDRNNLLLTCTLRLQGSSETTLWDTNELVGRICKCRCANKCPGVPRGPLYGR